MVYYGTGETNLSPDTLTKVITPPVPLILWTARLLTAIDSHLPDPYANIGVSRTSRHKTP